MNLIRFGRIRITERRIDRESRKIEELAEEGSEERERGRKGAVAVNNKGRSDRKRKEHGCETASRLHPAA